jgi:hypothetical protein
MQEDLVQEAESVGEALLRYKKANDPNLDRQSRDSYKDATILFQKLYQPVYHGNNYKLLFKCWQAFQCKEGLHGVEMQTGKVVRLTRLNEPARSLTELYNNFCLYTDLFGLLNWGINPFLKELEPSLPVVNTFKLYIESIKTVSAESFKSKTGIDPTLICEKLTGNKNLLINQLWAYHFTGLIDRVLNPGCKLDSMLILISKQKGWNKTRFIESIASNKNYSQPYTIEVSNVELYKLLEGKAVINFDECDAALKGKCASGTKKFISTTVDKYRASYGAKVEEHPRCGAFFGTSNNLEIIQDLDGDRRFYPVLLEQAIDINWFEENKELFLGYYKWLLSINGRTYPTADEQVNLVKGIQPQFKVQPLYFERLTEFLGYCKDKNFAFSTTDLLHAVITLLENQPKYEKTNVESLLSETGWSLSRAKSSTGVTPGMPKWSFAPLATLLTRVELKRQYEGWDQSH